MARREQYVNSAATTLSASMTVGTTSASVTDGSVFPTEGDFRIIIGTELMLVTARSGNTLTVVRGFESSVAASHSNTDSVDAILTAGALETYAEENTWHGNTSPALRIYDLATGARAISTDFTWLNQGSATATDRGNRIVLSVPQDAGDNIRGLYVSAPSTPYSIILGARGVGHADDFWQFALMFRENASSKIMYIQKQFTEVLQVAKFTNETTFSASLGTAEDWSFGPGITWFKIEDDGTDLFFYVGPNGQDWIQFRTEARGTFFTTSPDQVGFIMNPGSSNTLPGLLEVYHFGEE